MKPHRLLALFLIATVVSSTTPGAAAGQEGADRSLPHVRVVATGGTIAGRGQPGRVSGYRSGAVPIQELLAELPALDEVASVSSEQFSNVGSTSITPAQWLQLAQRINVILSDGVEEGPVDGVVVTHGTDALEETAYFLGLTVLSDKPVVMVGAMRPSTATSADGPLNLLNGIQVAAHQDARGRGVLVVLNQEINTARDATKTNTHRVQTFRSRLWGALGAVESDGPVFYRRAERRHTSASEFDVADLAPADLPRVDVSYTYNGADGTDVRAFVAAGADGIVVAGSGAGATTRGQGEALRAAAEAGVVVVRGTRTGSGRIAGGRGGALGADDLLPQKARVLLMVALTHTRDLDELRRIFATY